MAASNPRDPKPGEPVEPGGPRRPFFYPAGWGCLFWIMIIFLVYILLGLLWAPVWYPWWW